MRSVAMVVDACIELLSRIPYILFFTLLTCDQVD